MSYKLYNMLNECGVSVARTFTLLSESQQLAVSDETMGEMFKFVTSKYGSLDFSEIEKSNGNYRKFKYRQLLEENLQILRNIYGNFENKVVMEYVMKIQYIHEYLSDPTPSIKDMEYLYEKKNGMVQMFYISTVAAMVYGVSELIALTIRFINNDDDGDLDVYVDEIPNPQKYIHLKNIDTAWVLIKDGTLRELIKANMSANKKAMNEAVGVPIAMALPVAIALAVPALIYLSTKIIPFIREVIYSVYFTRVKWDKVIGVQVSLLKTNIDALEKNQERNPKKKRIIATQRRVVKDLEKLQNMIMVKSDQAKPMVARTIEQENREIKVNKTVSTPDDQLTDMLL